MLKSCSLCSLLLVIFVFPWVLPLEVLRHGNSIRVCDDHLQASIWILLEHDHLLLSALGDLSHLKLVVYDNRGLCSDLRTAERTTAESALIGSKFFFNGTLGSDESDLEFPAILDDLTLEFGCRFEFPFEP